MLPSVRRRRPTLESHKEELEKWENLWNLKVHIIFKHFELHVDFLVISHFSSSTTSQSVQRPFWGYLALFRTSPLIFRSSTSPPFPHVSLHAPQNLHILHFSTFFNVFEHFWGLYEVRNKQKKRKEKEEKGKRGERKKKKGKKCVSCGKVHATKSDVEHGAYGAISTDTPLDVSEDTGYEERPHLCAECVGNLPREDAKDHHDNEIEDKKSPAKVKEPHVVEGETSHPENKKKDDTL